MNIITNNIPRPLRCVLDLPAKAQKEFDYIEGDERFDPRLVQYKGEWYDVYDTMRCPDPVPADKPSPFAGWDSYISETFFSGVLFRFTGPASDEVIVGRYFA